MPFTIPPGSASHLSTTPTVAADKEGGEAGIVVDDDVIDVAAEKRLLRRLDLRIIPTIFFMGSYAIILNADTGDSLLQVLHMTTRRFDAVSAACFITTTLFQVPSNYMHKYFSPPYWLAFLILGWGATLMIMAASQNYITILLLRLLIGALEAGLVPGMIYFYTFWYRLQERSRRISIMYTCGPFRAAVGGGIAYAVGLLNGVRGLEGWRWLFLIEGAPSCFLAILVFLFLPAYPENATWLSDDDRALAVHRMKQESSKSLVDDKITWDGTKSTLKDGRLYLHYLLDIFSLIPSSSLFAVPIFAATVIGTVGLAVVADKYRIWSTCALLSYVLAGMTFIVQGPKTAWFTGNLRDTNATTLAIAISSALAMGSQVVGIFIYRSSEAPGYRSGHYTDAAIMFFCAVCTQLLRTIYKWRNKKQQNGENPWVV
ncbi:MFS general substrate transporter [Desarmillaria tabescens]|uniref:MFS general substrate transporter n=1 Tax=Armillaria tabescens TaxID=1929756 RepID=A0AA39JHS8_ARMTA|nr:MFS general substrate transporter [Desarmillaria tabescens]KAK0442031.1 MFS general substrate transporter [Desarmillaria tabescens]